MSFARGRIVLVSVSIQTDYETGGKGVSGMRGLPLDISQDAQKARPVRPQRAKGYNPYFVWAVRLYNRS